MSGELSILDWGFVGASVIFVVVGGLLGVSSQLGAVAAFVVAPLAAYTCWGFASAGSATFGFAGAGGVAIAVLIDLLIVFLVCGLVRMMVKKFVQGCLGGVVNAVAGALVGGFASLAILALMVGVGVRQPGVYGRGFCARHSSIVHSVAVWLDDRAGGRSL